MKVLVVLSHLMTKDGTLEVESKARAKLAIDKFSSNKYDYLITIGWAYRDDCTIPIADVVKQYILESSFINETSIIALTQSRDTVGDAIFSRKFIEPKFTIKKINVITSNYHLNRTSEIFEFVYGDNYIVNVIGVDVESPGGSDITEKKSLMQFRNTFSGIKKGDLSEIFNNMNKKHPFYNGEVFEK